MGAADAQRFWDDRARENALYFVDNRLDYESPDLETFWRAGEELLDQMLTRVELAIGPADDVLDIGCGVGRVTRALAARARRVYALDVSEEMLARARQHNPDLGNVRWLHGDGRTLGVLEDGCVDGCFSHVVFQHIPDPAVTLNYVREMGRVLRAGGWALFQVSTDPAVHRPPERRRARRLKASLTRSRAGDAWWWGSATDLDRLRQVAGETGLVVERVLDEGSQYTTVLARRAETAGS